MRIGIVACVTVLALTGTSHADVKPHALFSDGMVLQRDAKVNVWGKADAGEKVTVRFRDQEATAAAGADGMWKVQIGPCQTGEAATLTIKGNNTVEVKDVLVGEVWVGSGQSNMEWPVKASENPQPVIQAAANPNIRLFTVPKNVQKEPISEVKSKWVPCTPETVPNFSAAAYFFGRKLNADLNVPVGLIHSSWGGTLAEAWTSREALAANPRLKKEILDPFDRILANPPPTKEPPPGKKKGPQGPWHQNAPTALFNGMIAPIKNYTIRGAIWYQGESNAGRADQYRVLFPTMIECWRKDWGQGDFPFLFVQLAPWRPGTIWPELRESQRETDHKVPNTAMAVITDVGDPEDIHPKKKREVGERLAAAALQDVYKQPVVGHSPDVKNHEIAGSSIVIEFDNVGSGLVVRGDKLAGFTICGPDKKFVPADATLDGNKVIVRNANVSNPVAVRFGWTNLPEGNLFNKEGLPATPFRTDDFPFLGPPRPAVPRAKPQLVSPAKNPSTR
jgi:sialate O-acetylesterase